MRTFLFILLVSAMGFSANSQTKYITKNGYISFYSHTPFEDIKGENKEVGSIIDTENGEIIISLLMKSFRFNRALMEEHFNENYVESDKYPKGTFKGKITNLSAIDFKKSGIYNAEIEGDMTIHGVTKHITEKGTFEVKGNQIIGKSNFKLVVGDYNIIIPSVVKDKFADSFDVTVDLEYDQYKK
jgi:hypothetical protein